MLNQSPLHDLHAAHEASFIPYGPEDCVSAVVETFGDLDMEYAALRKGAVLFDSPHTGVLRVTGTDRLPFLNNMVTNKAIGLMPGQSRACFWLNRKGRIDADLLLCEFGDEMLIILDRHLAAPTAEALNAFVFAEDVEIIDASGELSILSLHGPSTPALLAHTAEEPIALDDPNATGEVTIAGSRVHAIRQDLTGEISVLLAAPRAALTSIHEKLLSVAQAHPELRARETGWLAINAARIEAGHPLFNVDFGPDNLPAESGVINQRVDFNKGCYLGQEVVARMHARNTRKQCIVALRILDQQITTDHTDIRQPTTGSQVFEDTENPESPVGAVTSSTISPMLGAVPICFAMLKDAYSKPGTKLRVLAEGMLVSAIVEPKLAFYTKP
ncbi:MAG: aminomethyltransferase family protein [Phycisphaerales bacterium]|nr:aminomethyltransferase family protein [Phycisphaerales bacterium]